MSEESRVQAQVIQYAKKRGLLVKRNYQAPGAEVGWPDLEIIGPRGKVLFLEMKAPGKKPTKLQLYRMLALLDRGHHASACDNYELGKGLIDDCFGF